MCISVDKVKMKDKTLKTFQAEISWLCVPWQSMAVNKHGGERYISGKSVQKIAQALDDDLTDNPATNDPKFWQHVRQWGFAFEDNDYDKVQGYYRAYGPLQAVPRSLFHRETGYRKLHNEESWGANKAALGWFIHLTGLLDHIKEGRLGPLWKDFGNPRMSGECTSVWFYPEAQRQKKGRGIGVPFYSIRWITPPWLNKMSHASNFIWLTPQNNDHVMQATWDVIVMEVQKMLNEISLTPATTGEHDNRNLTWRFIARGAFEAAFLQWYFQEVADYRPNGKRKKCPVCEEYLPLKKNPGNKRKYCSSKCRYADAYKKKKESAEKD